MTYEILLCIAVYSLTVNVFAVIALIVFYFEIKHEQKTKTFWQNEFWIISSPKQKRDAIGRFVKDA
jgi:hypothetical protein